jgi:hypothetical protein
MASNNPTREQLYFDSIKEDRGSYFVEYQPPVTTNPFATLTLVYPETHELGSVAETMKTEVAHWLNRYPVPVMVGAFDSGENTIYPLGNTGDTSLFGWYSADTATVNYSWKVEGLPFCFNDTTNLPDWRTIYKDVPFRTDGEVKANADRKAIKTRRQNLTLKVILAIWLAVIPASWAVIEFLGPMWLAGAVLLYSLLQAYCTARKLFWPTEPSQAEKDKAEKELKMRHSYWHCEQNPEGFDRLKVENFEREAKERIRKEVEALRNAKKSWEN